MRLLPTRLNAPVIGGLMCVLIGGGVLAVITDTVTFDNNTTDSDEIVVDFIEVAEVPPGLSSELSNCYNPGLDWQQLDVIPGGSGLHQLTEAVNDPNQSMLLGLLDYCVRTTNEVPVELSIQVDEIVETGLATSAAECLAESALGGAPCAESGELTSVLLTRFVDYQLNPDVACSSGNLTTYQDLAVTPRIALLNDAIGYQCRLTMLSALPALAGGTVSDDELLAIQTDRLQFDLVLTARRVP
jgi:hypothetical protein